MSDSLYERIGGPDTIKEIATSLFKNHTSNPTVNNRYVNSDPDEVIRLVTEFMCSGFGGPEEYTGKDMITAHTSMNISEEEFNAVVDDMMAALDENNIDQGIKDEILAILWSLRPEVIKL